MVNFFDKTLHEILEKKYEKSLENFIPEFGNLNHISANEIVGKINERKKEKKISQAKYIELSSLMSKFLFYINN